MIWSAIAKLVSIPFVADWLISLAKKRPYTQIPAESGEYMWRGWLFNPYPDGAKQSWLSRVLPSVRVHHIRREDREGHPHDHPWDFRTIVLRGWYNEQRIRAHFCRRAGDTATLNFGEYHHISAVSPGGVWTIFITWEKLGSWGFLVDGAKVPWREYFDQNQ